MVRNGEVSGVNSICLNTCPCVESVSIFNICTLHKMSCYCTSLKSFRAIVALCQFFIHLNGLGCIFNHCNLLSVIIFSSFLPPRASLRMKKTFLIAPVAFSKVFHDTFSDSPILYKRQLETAVYIDKSILFLT